MSYMTADEAASLNREEKEPAWKIVLAGLFWFTALYRAIKYFRNDNMGMGTAYVIATVVGIAVWAAIIWPGFNLIGKQVAAKQYTPATLAQSVSDEYANDGKTFDNAKCERQDGPVFRCEGDLTVTILGSKQTVPT